MTFDISKEPGEESAYSLDCFGRSTGLLPVLIPFSPLINMALFLAPFTDGGGVMSKYYINAIMEKSRLVEANKK